MSARYRQAPEAKERRVGRSLFLAHAGRGTLYRVNETVAAFWRLLEEPVTFEEATEVFRQAFPDEPAEQVVEHVRTMLDDLLDEGLVVPDA